MDHANFAGKQNILAQLWKEYALSDSRYLTGDSLILCAEGITACVWGPLSYFTAYAIVARKPCRHALQIMLSTALVYGATIVLATSLRDIYWRDIQHSRPEARYLWFYFFTLNFIWVVIPSSRVSASLFGCIGANPCNSLASRQLSNHYRSFHCMARSYPIAKPQKAKQ